MNNHSKTENGTARSAVALGFFDGVHRGHAAILATARQLARELRATSTALTFDQHPDMILHPQKAPLLLTTASEREELIAKLGIERVLTVHFDRELATTSAAAFVRDFLVRRLNAKAVVCGYDYRFGARGQGDAALLGRLGQEYGFRVVQLGPVRDGQTVISSTLIRQCLLSGQVEQANRLLGRRYAVGGVVQPGRGRGRKLGFPTANILPPARKLIPQDGVYAVEVRHPAGRSHLGLLSIGAKPTFAEDDRTIEVYIDGPNENLYGEYLELGFLSRLRGIVRFDSARGLQRQIEEDLKVARRIWSGGCCKLG